MSDDNVFLRQIKSFVRREGRMTGGQRRALETLWPRFGVDTGDEALDFTKLFGKPADTVLEIGFGMGESLHTMAVLHPERHYLGIEVHRPGVGALLAAAEQSGLGNLRVFCADAEDVITHIPDHSLAVIQIFFPDPWHKKRHHKRRLIRLEFARLLEKKLRPGGTLHIATDWKDYAEHIVAVLKLLPTFHNRSRRGDYCERPDTRPLTKFEQRGIRLGHCVFDMIYEKT